MPSLNGSPDILPVPVRSSPFLAATGLLTGPMPPFTGPTELLTEPTVPFPARLLDQAMPRLSDTEWRLLCVVVRQTLGWYDKETGGRKDKDWLTQSQLVARTGRSGRAVSESVAALTAQQMIQVLSDGGEALLTPEERRGYFGRHWFQMHPKWRDALTADTHKREVRLPASHRPYDETTQANKGSDNSAHGSRLWQEAYDVFAVTKDHTTKETDYKYKTQKKNEEGVEKVHTEKPHKENERTVPGRDLGRSLPERRSGSGHRENGKTPQVTLERGQSVRRGREPNVLTIHGQADPQVRTAWERDAAGQRWVWRKDIAQWVKADEVAETQKTAQQKDNIALPMVPEGRCSQIA